MKNGLSKMVLSLSASALLVSACSLSSTPQNESTHLSVGQVVDSNLPPKEKAEELAKQAETLLTAQGFLEAHRVAQLALKEDSQNLRAGLINAYLGPVLQVKGLYSRVRNLAARDPKLKANYDQQLAKLKNEMPESTFKNFILEEAAADLTTEAQLQAYLDQVSQAINQLRLFLKGIKQPEITIKANAFIAKDLNERFVAACEIKESKELEFELVCPPSEKRYDLTLNRADFAQLQDQASLLLIAGATYTAYDITGIIDLALANQNATQISGQKASEHLFKNPQFGKLRSTAQLQKVPELALDWIANMKTVMANQSTLCPYQWENGGNRPGKLFNKGICMHPSALSYFEEVERNVRGDVVDLISERDSQVQMTKARPGAFFLNPITDLRKLGQLEFDSCNQIRKIGDQTAGGILPNGDANKVLAIRVGECK